MEASEKRILLPFQGKVIAIPFGFVKVKPLWGFRKNLHIRFAHVVFFPKTLTNPEMAIFFLP